MHFPALFISCLVIVAFLQISLAETMDEPSSELSWRNTTAEDQRNTSITLHPMTRNERRRLREARIERRRRNGMRMHNRIENKRRKLERLNHRLASVEAADTANAVVTSHPQGVVAPPSDDRRPFTQHTGDHTHWSIGRRTPDVAWLAANLSSLWEAVRLLQRQHATGPTKVNNPIEAETATPSDLHSCEDLPQDFHAGDPHECKQLAGHCKLLDDDTYCSGNGGCCCGYCLCRGGYTGAFCECPPDDYCVSHEGLVCGGHGVCSCGVCHCEPHYTGDACECHEDLNSCKNPQTGTVCSNHGLCSCGHCTCDEGSVGQYCEGPVYSAGVCEELKPCVVCQVLGQTLPQCRDCGHITFRYVQRLELSHRTCVMIRGGCLLQYGVTTTAAPTPGHHRYYILLPRDMECPATKTT